MIFNTTQSEMRQIAASWITTNKKIIELGCSDGNFAKLLLDKNITNYIGIDILSDKIKTAQKRYPQTKFICGNIMDKLYYVQTADIFVSFQCLEHILDDVKIFQLIKKGTDLIFSVPNSPYKGHLRWFEMDGWVNRYAPYVKFEKMITIQNPNKSAKRSFLFKGVKI
jgi:2-polyprenyl-3-methyl-5-hydroxy-6-metoxy-1,4-benzoquinol methylase